MIVKLQHISRNPVLVDRFVHLHHWQLSFPLEKVENPVTPFRAPHPAADLSRLRKSLAIGNNLERHLTSLHTTDANDSLTNPNATHVACWKYLLKPQSRLSSIQCHNSFESDCAGSAIPRNHRISLDQHLHLTNTE